MQMNILLIMAFQFLYGFCLLVQHKPEKKRVVPDVLSRLANANANLSLNPNHSELDVLFAYVATLVQFSLSLVGKIICSYRMDEW